jgi:hypothetical protein
MKTTNPIFFILGFCIFLVFTASNCKDRDPVNFYYEPNPELMEWGVFQKGTWWVYEEENTKNTDSFWVDSFSKTFIKGELHNDVQVYHSSYKSYISSKSNTENMIYTIGSSSNICYYIRQGNNGVEFGERSFLLHLPLKIGKRVSFGPSWFWAELDTIYESIKVGGLVFKIVPRVYDMGNPAFNLDTTYFYTARNVGIIRKEFPKYNQIWNLVRFNIVQ